MRVWPFVVGATIGLIVFLALPPRPTAGARGCSFLFFMLAGGASFGLIHYFLTNGWLCRRGFHWWSSWTGDGCGFDRDCQWCRTPERRGPRHDWSEWFKTGEGCQTARTCRGCGKRQSGADRHEWQETVLSPCLTQQRCAACGKVMDVPAHDWIESSEDSAYCYVRTCRRCPEVQREHHSYAWGCYPDGGSTISGSQMVATCTHYCDRCTASYQHGIELA
jgi:hypothetical protein